ncbi:GNAT family N-acetyltransferase [Paragemmobacter ruber]|uniref:GNAT family N-acetyltransferase n=1 Tax=Paragemmobacter ruber TaxID=1985673 RepID=A0ABW9Y2K7_9RHOB|nr:GNAT family N-acetyltransferase [Rhodobacter ruber]NBE06726.1 GNAT family N-acetyltransferase [Rhodobacter ruber]
MADPVIRPMVAADLPALRAVLAETGLFPPDLLADLAGPWLGGQAQAIWLTARYAGGVAGFCHARPEPLTEGTWNLLALAVHPRAQRQGLAMALLSGAEGAMRRAGARLCLVDTAGTPDFAAARRLYRRAGFRVVARIPGYWAEGVDKVTCLKPI